MSSIPNDWLPKRGLIVKFPDTYTRIHSIPNHIFLAREARKLNDPLSVWLTDFAVHELTPYWRDNFDLDKWQFHFGDFLSEHRWVIGQEVPWHLIINRRSTHWIDDIIRAKRLHMAFQPIVRWDGHTPTLYGHELLARGKMNTGRSIDPEYLFETAASNGRLYQLDRYCRTEALRSARFCPPDTKVFINLVPSAIYSIDDFMRFTYSEVKRLNISPSRIVFEIVENDALLDLNHMKTIVDACHECGFSLALDDVGKGQNTIDRIAQLQPDVVKLDRKYVHHIDQNPYKQSIARLVADEAYQVGAICIAEGIERVEEGQYLSEHGYPLLQGYLFGKPNAHPLTNEWLGNHDPLT